MIEKIKNLFEKKRMKLMHPTSPGDKVIVYRNWFQRKFKSNDFATLHEAIKSYETKDVNLHHFDKSIWPHKYK